MLFPKRRNLKTCPMAMFLLATLLVGTGYVRPEPAVAQESPESSLTAESTQWIWDSENATKQTDGEPRYFQLQFSLDDQPNRGVLVVHCDNRYTVWLNGSRVGSGDDWKTRDQYEVSTLLKKSQKNTLAIQASNDAGSPAGLSVALVVATESGPRYWYSGEAEWKVSRKPGDQWKTKPLQEATPAVALGAIADAAPWGGQFQWKQVQQKPTVQVRRPAQDTFSLLPSDRLTFLGSGFIERMQWDTNLESQIYEACCNSESGIAIRNLGWAGDDVHGTARAVFGSVDDGMKRLTDDLFRTQPTVVALCYGSNESFAGEKGLDDFREGLQALVDQIQQSGAKVVLITPPPFESLGAPLPDMQQANRRLDLYCDAMRKLAAEQNWELADLHRAMTRRLKDQSLPAPFTEDGVHLNQEGYRAASQELVGMLVPDHQPVVSGTELHDLIRTKNEYYFHRYRPQNETYLFLFRKHEQGNNAVEIPQFDGLVEQTERQIQERCQQ